MSVTVELKDGRRKQASYRDANIIAKLGKGHIVTELETEAEEEPREEPTPKKGKSPEKKKSTYKRKDMTAEETYEASKSVNEP